MKKTILSMIIALAVSTAMAQTSATTKVVSDASTTENSQSGNHAFIGAGFGSTSSINIGGLHNWGFNKFNVGLGLRAGYNMSNDQKYMTAPAKFTKDVKNHDTLYVKDAHSIIATNLYLNLSYNITSKFYAGFNIDLVGFSIGGQADSAAFKSSSENAGLSAYSDAKATSVNTLLIGDNDRGTINSNFFVGYQLNNNWGIQAGMGMLFTELTSEKELGVNKVKRYRNKLMQGVVNVTYKF